MLFPLMNKIVQISYRGVAFYLVLKAHVVLLLYDDCASYAHAQNVTPQRSK